MSSNHRWTNVFWRSLTIISKIQRIYGVADVWHNGGTSLVSGGMSSRLPPITPTIAFPQSIDIASTSTTLIAYQLVGCWLYYFLVYLRRCPWLDHVHYQLVVFINVSLYGENFHFLEITGHNYFMNVAATHVDKNQSLNLKPVLDFHRPVVVSCGFRQKCLWSSGLCSFRQKPRSYMLR